MSNVPPDYVKTTSFTTLATLPITSAGLPGSELDSEFNKVATTVNQTIDRLALIQKDDGTIRSKLVTIDSLSPETTAAITAAGARITGEWVAGLSYLPGDIVIYGADNYAYICADQHTSSASFESDFSAKVWAIMGYRPSTSDLVVKTFTGDGANLTFNLGIDPVSENNTQVFVSGVYKSKSTYSISGTNLVFGAGNAPANAAPIEVVIGVPAEIMSSMISVPNNSVGTPAIIDLSVTGAKIANLAITTGKLADFSITSSKIENNAVGSTKIADSSITTDKLVGGAVTNLKLAPGAVDVSNIVDSAIESDKIANGAVISSKIGNSQVTTEKIADLQITTAKIADAQVTAEKLSPTAVSSANISNDSITGAKLGGTNVPCQVVQQVMVVKRTFPTNTWTTIPELSTTITRLKTTSKVRIQGSIACSTSSTAHGMAFRLFRSISGVEVQIGFGTEYPGFTQTQPAIAVGIGAGNGTNVIQPVTFDFIDTGTVGAINTVTYVVKAYTYTGVFGYINMPSTTANANYVFNPISTLTLTELT
jgi:hypothetical protein